MSKTCFIYIRFYYSLSLSLSLSLLTFTQFTILNSQFKFWLYTSALMRRHLSIHLYSGTQHIYTASYTAGEAGDVRRTYIWTNVYYYLYLIHTNFGDMFYMYMILLFSLSLSLSLSADLHSQFSILNSNSDCIHLMRRHLLSMHLYSRRDVGDVRIWTNVYYYYLSHTNFGDMFYMYMILLFSLSLSLSLLTFTQFSIQILIVYTWWEDIYLYSGTLYSIQLYSRRGRRRIWTNVYHYLSFILTLDTRFICIWFYYFHLL